MEDILADLVIAAWDLVVDLVSQAMAMDSDIQVMAMAMDAHFGLPDQKFHRRVRTLSRTLVERSRWQLISPNIRNKLFILVMAMPVATTTVLAMDLEEWEVTLHYTLCRNTCIKHLTFNK